MFFGKKLKELRLKHSKKGLRNFALEIEIKPTELSNIELGYNKPPDDTYLLHKIITAFNISSHHKDWLELMILYRRPFVMQLMDENMMPSPLTHKSDGTPLTKSEFISLAEHVNNIAKEHNKKAREHNEEEE